MMSLIAMSPGLVHALTILIWIVCICFVGYIALWVFGLLVALISVWILHKH